jgi:hypothetical protein
LSANVSFPDSFHLSLSVHVHGFIAANCPPRCRETEEAESGIDAPFDESMVLLAERSGPSKSM